MKAILWILLLVFLALWAAYPFVFHCSYGWDVEQMRIVCKAAGE